MNWPDYKDRLKRYFWFSKKEVTHFAILTVVFAFMFSFNKWGVDSFDAASGAKNFIIAIALVAISLFIHHAAQRFIALKFGFKPEQFIWWPGILLGLVLIIFSNGNIMVFAGSYLLIHQISHYRLGRRRIGPNIRTWGYIALFGPVINVAIAGLAFAVNLSLGSDLLNNFMWFNFMLAIYNALPFPPLDGGIMFFASRMTYAFFAGVIYGYLLLIYAFGIIGLSAIFISVLIGCICWLGFYFFFEKISSPPV